MFDVKFVRGGRKPFVVDWTSSIAEGEFILE
jgi:hypothetical protein